MTGAIKRTHYAIATTVTQFNHSPSEQMHVPCFFIAIALATAMNSFIFYADE